MKHYNFLFLMADQIRTATLEGMGGWHPDP